MSSREEHLEAREVILFGIVIPIIVAAVIFTYAMLLWNTTLKQVEALYPKCLTYLSKLTNISKIVLQQALQSCKLTIDNLAVICDSNFTCVCKEAWSCLENPRVQTFITYLITYNKTVQTIAHQLHLTKKELRLIEENCRIFNIGKLLCIRNGSVDVNCLRDLLSICLSTLKDS